MLDNLEHSYNIESCQWACQINPMCNFFTFSKDNNVCILHRMDVRHRKCDIIHGPPVPSLQSCLDDVAIPWASSSGKLLTFQKIMQRQQLLYFMYIPNTHMHMIFFGDRTKGIYALSDNNTWDW